MDWQRYWEEFPARFAEDEFCKQVARTAHGGQPTPKAELEVAVEQVRIGLDLQRNDRLLDLCCGNGFLTRRLAPHALQATGVDFSRTMIEIAQHHHQLSNTSFVCGSVLDLPRLFRDLEHPFTKVCLLESLHYFEGHDLDTILRGVRSVAVPNAVLYFSGVTDAERKHLFYNTEQRRREHAHRVSEGTDVMGHWWSREEIVRIVQELGFECSFLPQNPRLNTAHCRFDLKLQWKPDASAAGATCTNDSE